MAASAVVDSPAPARAAAAPGAPASRSRGDAVVALALGAGLAAIAFVAGGGQRLAPTTWVSAALVVVGATLGLRAVLHSPAGRRPAGLGALAGIGALGALTAASITWAVNPSDAWEETNRTLSYVAAFGGAIAAARLTAPRWAGVIHGIALACVAVSAYALLTRVAPGWVAEDEVYARLREPFGYWNSVGLMAASGVPPLLWLAARRTGHGAVNALAWPGLGLLVVCVMLSYSRGTLLALIVGLAFWFAVVPLRLRGAAVLAGSALAAAMPVAWAFSRDELTTDDLPLAVRSDAGIELGALLVLMLALLLGLGLAAGFLRARHVPSPRARRLAGRAAVGAVALLPVIALGALAAAPGGISGQTSKAWDQLTDVDARTPANTPGRLTATASVRSRYWREALDVHAERPWLGAGAGGYATARTRHRTTPLNVRHAHGYVVQTLADLGWAGLAVSLAALLAWIVAAARATSRRAGSAEPERIGLLTLVAVVVVFGVHSLVDWSWFIPANAVVALVAAGWVAGRGSPRAPGAAGRRPAWRRAAWGTLVAATTAVALWSVLQPLRAVEKGDEAFALASGGDLAAAVAAAREGADRNPVAVEPLWEIAVLEDRRGRVQEARAALEAAVRLQPARAETWTRLGRYRLSRLEDPRGALEAFRAAFHLDRASPAALSDLLEAMRATS